MKGRWRLESDSLTFDTLETRVSRLCLSSSVILVFFSLSLPSMAAEAWGKWCHNVNRCPCWIHKIITHTCHLFVMILSLLTYLHIKALIKISEERDAYFKINSEGDAYTASKVVLFLFAVVFLFVCALFTRLSQIFMKCLLWLKSSGKMCQISEKRLLRVLTPLWMCVIKAGTSSSFFLCLTSRTRTKASILVVVFSCYPKPPRDVISISTIVGS